MKRLNKTFHKKILALTLAGVTALGAIGVAGAWLSTPTAQAAQSTKVTVAEQKMALETLMSFYKPALSGHFPTTQKNGEFVIGKTTRETVLKAIGLAEQPRTAAAGFDEYHAEMGHSGYALAYDAKNVLKEIRYFGTNVERETNIGGITMAMLKQHWYTPASTSTIANTKQTKLTYVRGSYKVEFIFNSATKLDHINLTHK